MSLANPANGPLLSLLLKRFGSHTVAQCGSLIQCWRTSTAQRLTPCMFSTCDLSQDVWASQEQTLCTFTDCAELRRFQSCNSKPLKKQTFKGNLLWWHRKTCRHAFGWKEVLLAPFDASSLSVAYVRYVPLHCWLRQSEQNNFEDCSAAKPALPNRPSAN